jgi:hypothetical protein
MIERRLYRIGSLLVGIGVIVCLVLVAGQLALLRDSIDLNARATAATYTAVIEVKEELRGFREDFTPPVRKDMRLSVTRVVD